MPVHVWIEYLHCLQVILLEFLGLKVAFIMCKKSAFFWEYFLSESATGKKHSAFFFEKLMLKIWWKTKYFRHSKKVQQDSSKGKQKRFDYHEVYYDIDLGILIRAQSFFRFWSILSIKNIGGHNENNMVVIGYVYPLNRSMRSVWVMRKLESRICSWATNCVPQWNLDQCWMLNTAMNWQRTSAGNTEQSEKLVIWVCIFRFVNTRENTQLRHTPAGVSFRAFPSTVAPFSNATLAASADLNRSTTSPVNRPELLFSAAVETPENAFCTTAAVGSSGHSLENSVRDSRSFGQTIA